MTLKDVAAETELSPAAVSYALRGIQTSAETQARVREAAARLGYTGNAVARALSEGRTRMIGVLAASLQDLGEQSFVAAIGQALERHDLHMVLVDSGGDPERERALAAQLADLMVDGLVVSPLDPSDESWQAVGDTIPVVTVGDALSGPTVGEVLFDNRAGVSIVLEHLAELGHRHVAVLTPSRPSTPERPAEQVIGAVCRRLGLEPMVVNSRHSIAEATATARSVLESDPRPTAVFCLSDSIACGVYAAAAELGLSIPQDVSVAGYDDHPIATSLSPALTTVLWGWRSWPSRRARWWRPPSRASHVGAHARACAWNPRSCAATPPHRRASRPAACPLKGAITPMSGHAGARGRGKTTSRRAVDEKALTGDHWRHALRPAAADPRRIARRGAGDPVGGWA